MTMEVAAPHEVHTEQSIDPWFETEVDGVGELIQAVGFDEVAAFTPTHGDQPPRHRAENPLKKELAVDERNGTMTMRVLRSPTADVIHSHMPIVRGEDGRVTPVASPAREFARPWMLRAEPRQFIADERKAALDTVWARDRALDEQHAGEERETRRQDDPGEAAEA